MDQVVAEFAPFLLIDHMPSNIPSQLNIEPPVDEEDIGDLSPYLSFPSTTSSRASSSVSLATINSSSCSNTSPKLTKDHEFDHDDDPSSSGTPRNQFFAFHLTPSNDSYSLTTNVSRSQGLPPVQKDSSTRPLCKEIDALEVDPVSVAKIRRWILGIALGESALPPARLHLVTSS